MERIFPTLLAQYDVPECEALNRGLAEFIHELAARSRDYSSLSTVRHGWQSGFDLLEYDADAIRALRAEINRGIESFLEAWGAVSFGSLAPRSFRYRYNGWAVVLRGGGFQHEHVHSRSDLVGVYYVATPADGKGGKLSLIDPRAGRLASRAIWDITHVDVTPRPGLLVLFPSFVPHRVNQIESDGERISINFDVTLEGVA